MFKLLWIPYVQYLFNIESRSYPTFVILISLSFPLNDDLSPFCLIFFLLSRSSSLRIIFSRGSTFHLQLTRPLFLFFFLLLFLLFFLLLFFVFLERVNARACDVTAHVENELTQRVSLAGSQTLYLYTFRKEKPDTKRRRNCIRNDVNIK